MKLIEIKSITEPFGRTEQMPVLFLGHGSPMNAIENNEFTAGWEEIGKTLPRPSAIFCVSAHWEIRGIHVTAMKKPLTIHDFGGFPEALFAVHYPAEENPELAKELSSLRKKGVLINGSGNIVHNLGMVALDKLNSTEYGYDWATEANEKMNKYIINGDHASLIKYQSQGRAFSLAIPTPEYFLPLLYTLALKEENEELTLFNDKIVAGSLSMTSVRIAAT